MLEKTSKIYTQKSLAQDIGYSVGKVNYILKALVEKGFVKIDNFTSSDNKRKYSYLLTKEGFQEKVNLTEKFIQRKKAEYEKLQEELDSYKQEKEK